jgi:hypothetical protein
MARSIAPSIRASSLAKGLLCLALSGCAGGLDPALFPPTGVAGASGSGGMVCNAPAMVLTPKCGLPGCHGASAPQSGLDLASTGLVARLIDHTPSATLSLSCGASTKPYLVSQSNPASGLLLDKLDSPPPCGAQMPLGAMLDASDRACVDAWALAVTTGVVTQ